MRSRIPHVLAALAAATTTALAFAAVPQQAGAPAYVSEPVASASAGAQAGDTERLNGIVEALNADASLKGSKLTVMADGEVVYLTGVTLNRDQMTKAVQIAGSNGGKVANAMTTEEMKVVQSPALATVDAAWASASDSPASQAASAPAAPGETIQPATPDGEKILPATPQT